MVESFKSYHNKFHVLFMKNNTNVNLFILTLILLASTPVSAASGALAGSLAQPQAAFFETLSALCGKAFAGKMAVNRPKNDAFNGIPLIMHVQKCSDTEIRIPFHVGNNRSRTWVISKTKAGLMLKHEHLHEDGTDHVLTQYGGVAVDAGWNSVQSFPADLFTKTLFVNQQIPQSNDNIWQIYVYPDRFSYRLVGPAKEFRVDFDLTETIQLPPPPWGAGLPDKSP
jgi:hypothetical protein